MGVAAAEYVVELPNSRIAEFGALEGMKSLMRMVVKALNAWSP